MRKGWGRSDIVFRVSLVVILAGLVLLCIGLDLPRVEPAMFGSP
jgi:hypothetical protein